MLVIGYIAVHANLPDWLMTSMNDNDTLRDVFRISDAETNEQAEPSPSRRAWNEPPLNVNTMSCLTGQFFNCVTDGIGDIRKDFFEIRLWSESIIYRYKCKTALLYCDIEMFWITFTAALDDRISIARYPRRNSALTCNKPPPDLLLDLLIE